MKKSTSLFEQLEQSIAQLYTEHNDKPDKKIRAKFNRLLFTEDNQSFQFYFKQIQHTLNQFIQPDENNIEMLNFLSNKLLAQCNALTEAMKRERNHSVAKSTINFKPVLSRREKLKQDINRLPPRERLEKYYAALLALNEKIEVQKDLYHNTTNTRDKTHYAQQIQITEQRKQRCLDAIELLEEYLTFKKN